MRNVLCRLALVTPVAITPSRAVVAATVITRALGSAATPALADSLVYVKGDIPYISATDGTDAHVATND